MFPSTLRCIVAISVVFFSPLVGWAHKDDYLDETFVFETIARRVFVLEYRTQYLGSSRNRSLPSFWVQSPFLEYGLTNRTMLETRLSWGTPRSNTQFAGGFLQIRHRLGEEGEHLLDPAVAIEYETEREEDGRIQHFIVPILVLSKDVGDFNLTGNVLFRTKLSGNRSLKPEYALRISLPKTWNPLWGRAETP